MPKVKSGHLITVTINQNYKDTIGRFVESNNAYSFANSVKRTPVY